MGGPSRNKCSGYRNERPGRAAVRRTFASCCNAAPGPFWPGIRNGAVKSALGELEAAAGLGFTVLLALDHARIAREEAAALECATQIRLIGQQGLRDTMSNGACLSRQSTARHRANDIELSFAIGGGD